MALAERGNVVLDIKDSEVDRYFDLGYDIKDDDGTLIKKAIPRDIGVLQKAYTEHIATIKELEKENAELKAQIKKASTTAKKPSPKKE